MSTRLVSTQAPTTPNKARNGGQAYLHLARHTVACLLPGPGSKACRADKSSAQRHSTSLIRHLCFHPAVSEISWRARNASDRQLGKQPTPEHSKTTPFYYMTLYPPARPPVAWLTSLRQQFRLIGKYRHSTLANNRKHPQVSKHYNIHCYNIFCHIRSTVIRHNVNYTCSLCCLMFSIPGTIIAHCIGLFPTKYLASESRFRTESIFSATSKIRACFA